MYIKLESFGFRGEALAALCQICSSMTVTTKTEADETATRLLFTRDGHVAERTPVSRSTGTTVSLAGLFATMPVRVKELSKNKKRELSKAVAILQGYAVSAVGVRVVCTHVTAAGKREELICTEGGTLRENVARIFGGEFARGLFDFKCTVPASKSSALEDNDENDTNESSETVLAGLITKGAGRSAQDRQLFFLNGRPVDLPRIAKLINTTYHSILGQSKQSQRFFQYPSFVLTLTAPPGTFDINITPDKRTVLLHNEDAIVDTLKEDLTNAWEPLLATFEQSAGGSLLKLSPAGSSGVKRHQPQSQPQTPLSSQKKKKQRRTPVKPGPDDDNEIHTSNEGPEFGSAENGSRQEFQTCRISGSMKRSSSLIKLGGSDEETFLLTDEKTAPHGSSSLGISVSTLGINFSDAIINSIMAKNRGAEGNANVGSSGFSCKVGVDDDAKCVEELTKVLTKQKLGELEVVGQFNLGFIIARDGPDLFIVDQHASDEIYNFESLQKTTSLNIQPLLAPVNLELSAEDTVLVANSLEIFRRHGLILSVESENGDGDGPATSRVKLVSCAYSKGTSFGVSDVYELISMLRELPGETTADNMLSRVRAMFASRACRKSVMIGTALGAREMKRILEHLATLDKPWRCPHGRPTIRHLVNLTQLRK